MNGFAITVFRCSNCRSRHDTKDKADACCVCKCGRAIEKESHQGFGVSRECRVCGLKHNIHITRGRIRKLKADLAGDEKHLVGLKAKLEEALSECGPAHKAGGAS